MGSFDVACGLSNLTIHYGDEAGIVPLVKNETAGEFRLFDVYPTTQYIPYLPPMFGVYDDYGRLTSVDSSNATASLVTDVFRLPADVVLACIGNYGRDIHSKFGPLAENYENKIPGRVPQHRESPKDYLESLGFISDSLVEEIYYFGDHEFFVGEHKYQIRAKDSRGYISIHEGSFSSIESALHEFALKTKTVPGFDPKDYLQIVELANMYGMFVHKEVYEKAISGVNPKFTLEAIQQTIKARNSFSYLRDNNIHTKELFRKLGISSSNFRNSVDLFSIAADLIDLDRFHALMSQVNRIFAPTMCGEQMGNDEASLQLVQISQEILQRNLSELE